MISFPVHVMNVNNTTALTRELKLLEAPFLPTDDPQILWLKYQILFWRIKNNFGYAKISRKQKVFKPIATDKVKDRNINFESNKTSLVSEIIQTKQSLLSPRVSSSHQIPYYHTNTKSKLNECINKLTLPYFTSFCWPFHIPFFYNIFDQRLLCCYEKLFFQPVHKKLWKLRNDSLLMYRLLHYFPMLSKNSIL